MIKKWLYVLLCCGVFICHAVMIPVYAGGEEEIGRSNIGEWNGGYFYEYMTKEYLGEDDKNDTITYRIRYRLKHWGAWYTYQVTPIQLYINNAYVTTFQSEINTHVANDDRVHGTYDVTMKKGVENKMELRDTGVSITVINVSGTVFAPLPQYDVRFVDGFGHELKRERVTKYQNATEPYTPIKDGKTFVGWDKAFHNITSNVTITAMWKSNMYRVLVDPNGGVWNGKKDASTFHKPAGTKMEIANPTRMGYMFDGWEVQGLGLLDGFVHPKSKKQRYDVLMNVSTIGHGWKPPQRNNVYYPNENMEMVRLELGNALEHLFDIQYRVYVENVGWRSWTSNGGNEGSQHANTKLEAIQITLTGAMKRNFDIEYRVYMEGIGWMPWAHDMEVSGRVEEHRAIQGLQVRIQQQAQSIPQNHTYYVLSEDSQLVAQWLPLPYIDAAYDRWFLVQENITKEDILRVVKAYDEHAVDISNTIVMTGFENVKVHQVGEYLVHVSAISSMGNTCEADIMIHIVDKLTKEKIRSIEETQMDTLDRESKWQRNITILQEKIRNKDIRYDFKLGGKKEK